MAAIVIGGNTKATWLGGDRRLAGHPDRPGKTGLDVCPVCDCRRGHFSEPVRCDARAVHTRCGVQGHCPRHLARSRLRPVGAVGFPGDTAQAGTPAGTAVDRRERCLPDAQ
jgi:hypothetical protein